MMKRHVREALVLCLLGALGGSPAAAGDVLLGDLDGNGAVDGADVAALEGLLSAAGAAGDDEGSLMERLQRNATAGTALWTRNESSLPFADTTLDGRVDQSDASLLRTLVAARGTDPAAPRTHLLELLLGHDTPDETALASELDELRGRPLAEGRSLLGLLREYLAAGGGRRVPAPAEPGGTMVVPAREVALLAAADLLDDRSERFVAAVGDALVNRPEALAAEAELRDEAYGIRDALGPEPGGPVRERAGLLLEGLLARLDEARPRMASLAAGGGESRRAWDEDAAGDPAPPPPRSSTPWWLLGGAVIVLGGAGVAVAAGRRGGTSATASPAAPAPDGASPLRRAEMHLRYKHWDKAVPELQKALEGLEGEAAEPLRLLLATAFAGQGRTEVAGRIMDEVELVDADPAVLVRLARLFEEKADAGRAERLLRVVLAVAPDNREARRRLEALEARDDGGGLIDERALERLLAPRYGDFQLLGKGGMGLVYRAQDRQLRRVVALKIISPLAGADESLRSRFEREVQALARLDHPAIVKVFDYGLGELPYYAMELLEGRPLSDLVGTGELRGDFPRMGRMVATVCDGLEHAYLRGILHRDIKPENIVVGNDGSVKVVDFGLARLVDRSALTQSAQVVGTLLYLAPEILLGDEPTPASEVYSLGVVLYQLVSGQMPWTQEQVVSLAPRVFPPVEKLELRCPPALASIVARCLAEEAEDRYASFGELRSAATAAVGLI